MAPEPVPAKQDPPKQPMVPFSRRVVTFLVGLLILNLLLSFVTGGPPKREQVPYQPFFVQQLDKSNVSEITSRGDSIEGKLAKTAKYDPPGDKKPVDVTTFKTLVPSFIDRADLTKLVSQKGVVINAEPPAAGRGFLASLLLGFAPTLLLVGFFIWIARRQTGGGAGGILGGFGRSTARRAVKDADRVNFEDVAGI